MSDIERARIRKEAADSVVAKPPRDDDSGTAVRRYLGIALQQTLRRRREAVRKPAPPATASPPEAKSGSEEPEQRP